MRTYKTPNPESVLVVGATSSLAQALCRALAEEGYGLVLCGRDEHELDVLASDLRARFGMDCPVLLADVMEKEFSAEALLAQAGDFTHCVIALGDMGSGDRDDEANIAHVAATNYIAPAQIASAAAAHLEAQKKKGTLAVITSVAGDRGRQSNYPYGSAKAALAVFAAGLRNRYAAKGIHVMTVKPGFIDTPMTWGMHSPLIADRMAVAKTIASGMRKKKDTLYVPYFWRWIMGIIIHIPERIFKRLSL